MMSERESHGMNCAHRSDSDEPCTCACRYHAAVDTERTMHAAWRKRAEEAERENADLRARLALAVAEVKAWRAADGEHDWTGEANGPQHLITSVMFAMGATDSDPELAKMMGGG